MSDLLDAQCDELPATSAVVFERIVEACCEIAWRLRPMVATGRPRSYEARAVSRSENETAEW